MCKQVNARGSNDRFIVVRGSSVFKRSRGAFPRLRHESCVLAGAGAGATKQQAGHLKKSSKTKNAQQPHRAIFDDGVCAGLLTRVEERPNTKLVFRDIARLGCHPTLQ
jgi:hypothetical protein